MNRKRIVIWLAACYLYVPFHAQKTDTTMTYRVEMSGNISNGTYAPLWFTANRYGLSSQKPNSGYIRAGVLYDRELNRHWHIRAGLDLAGAADQVSSFVVQQAYADVSWKFLRLSIGSKERPGFPLEKNERLSSGMMVEGPNARPVPQVRVDIPDYLTIPRTGGWLALKGHVAYGAFTDENWQEDFVSAGNTWGRHVLYHSKSLMFRIGNREKFPAEFEFGLLMAAQFAGDQMLKDTNGTSSVKVDMPDGLESFFKALIPTNGNSSTPWGEQVNVEGNHLGSWNFALTYYLDEWKFRAYLEHYFDDHSQMVWQYGRWKDGQLGIEVSLPKNRWISTVLWEGLSTKDQTGPILYDEFAGTLGYQVSGSDDYYNNYLYQSWQHWGQGMGNPFLYGPIYNADGTLEFKSNRVRANHLGLCGDPGREWNWRILVSFVRHWGTYVTPLDKQRKQFSSLYEVTYLPGWAKGWGASVGLGFDRGNYLGNSTGGLLTIKKTGILF